MKKYIYLLLLLCFWSFSQKLETSIQRGHRSSVLALALNSPQTILASGSRDKSIILWDVATRKQIRVLTGHTASVKSLAFIPKSNLLISGANDQRVLLWDIESGKLLQEITKCEDVISSVAVHPSLPLVAVGGHSFTIDIYNYKTFELIKQIPTEPDKSMGMGVQVSFSEDGTLLLTGEDDKKAKAYSVEGFTQSKEFKNTYGWCGGCGTHLQMDPQNKFIAKLAHKDSVRIYDVLGNQQLARLGRDYSEISNIVFSPSSTNLYFAADDTLFELDYVNRTFGKKIDLKPFNCGSVPDILYLNDKKTLLLSSGKGLILEIDVLSGHKLGEFSGINFKSDKGGLDFDPEDYWSSFKAKIINLKTRFLVSPDEKSFITGKMGLNAIEWDMISGEPEYYFGDNKQGVICFDNYPEKNLLVLGNGEGEVVVWDYSKKKILKKIEAHREPIFEIKIVPQQQCIAVVAYDGNMTLWDMNTFERIQYIDLPDNYSAYTFNTISGGMYYMISGLNKKLYLLEPDSKKVVKEFYGHTDVISKIIENPINEEFATCSWDGTIRIWNTNSGLCKLKINAKTSLNDIVYNKDYTKIFACGADGFIKVYDVKNGSLLYTLTSHQADVTQLSLNQENTKLYSISVDGALKYWDLNNKEEIYEHIRLSEKEWMVKSPQGYFNATSGARNAVNFVKGTEVFAIDQFFEKYYRPDLLEKVYYRKLKMGSIQEDLQNSYSESLKMALIPIKDDGGKAWLYVKVPHKNSSQIKELRYTHNGRPFTAEMETKIDSAKSLSKTIKFKVNLVSGMNHFAVHPILRNNIEAKPTQIQYFAENNTFETRCHLFVIGINEYQNSSLKLNYARNDAESFASSFKEHSQGLYKEVVLHEFYDKNASKRKILDSLHVLSKTVAVHDVFVLYYAGHGSVVNDMFYLIPQDCQRLYDADKVSSQGISAKELQESFKKIKALKQVVIMDACQSGGGVQTLAMRGVGEEKAMAQLSRSAGVHIFASAGSEQNAKEISVLRHGLFTYVLLQAMTGAADGSPRDEKITIFEIKSYLDDQMPEVNQQYSGKIQFPYTFSIGQDFPLLYK